MCIACTRTEHSISRCESRDFKAYEEMSRPQRRIPSRQFNEGDLMKANIVDRLFLRLSDDLLFVQAIALMLCVSRSNNSGPEMEATL
jgi:hypothetical protein